MKSERVRGCSSIGLASLRATRASRRAAQKRTSARAPLALLNTRTQPTDPTDLGTRADAHTHTRSPRLPSPPLHSRPSCAFARTKTHPSLLLPPPRRFFASPETKRRAPCPLETHQASAGEDGRRAPARGRRKGALGARITPWCCCSSSSASPTRPSTSSSQSSSSQDSSQDRGP